MAIRRTIHRPIQHWPPGLLHSFLFLPCLGPAEFGYLLQHSYMCSLPSYVNCFPRGHLGSTNWIAPEEIPGRALCLSERKLGSLEAAVITGLFSSIVMSTSAQVLCLLLQQPQCCSMMVPRRLLQSHVRTQNRGEGKSCSLLVSLFHERGNATKISQRCLWSRRSHGYP